MFELQDLWTMFCMGWVAFMLLTFFALGLLVPVVLVSTLLKWIC